MPVRENILWLAAVVVVETYPGLWHSMVDRQGPMTALSVYIRLANTHLTFVVHGSD